MTREGDYVIVYQDTAGEWRWTRKAGNNETIADSAEGYVNESYALQIAADVNPGVPVELEP